MYCEKCSEAHPFSFFPNRSGIKCLCISLLFLSISERWVVVEILSWSQILLVSSINNTVVLWPIIWWRPQSSNLSTQYLKLLHNSPRKENAVCSVYSTRGTCVKWVFDHHMVFQSTFFWSVCVHDRNWLCLSNPFAFNQLSELNSLLRFVAARY